MNRTEVIDHMQDLKAGTEMQIHAESNPDIRNILQQDADALEYCLDLIQVTSPGRYYMENRELTTICDCHHMIRSIVAQTIEDLDPESAGWISGRLQDIYEIAGKALDMGQSMEDRLTEYYEGICSLGFERMQDEKL